MSGSSIGFTETQVEAFPTRILRRQYNGLEALNSRLSEIILEKEKVSSGVSAKSNVGGWHSDTDLLKWGNPELEILLQLIQTTLIEYASQEINKAPTEFSLSCKLDAWANINRAGEYSKPHVHPMANFAVVYYVDVGDAEKSDKHDPSGCIEFIDPRNRPLMLSSPAVNPADSLMMRPESSTMLIFPAWMYHYVHPYKGTRPRISIAANAVVTAVNPMTPDSGGARPKARIIEEEE